jgi:hypothetical protein
MEVKEKECKGINKASGHTGCGKLTKYRTFGLCNNCLAGFLFDTDKGKVIFQKSLLTAKKEVKAKEKKQVKEQKEKLKTLSELEADAKRVFQKYIRLRDKDKPCISCGIQQTDLWDGGHYKKAEIYSGVIFDENNVHKQCRKCNRFLGGNELNYRDGLIQRFNVDFVENIELKANETRKYKYTKEELKEIKEKYLKKIKQWH